MARVYAAGGRLRLYGKSLLPAFCILLMANCQKHSVKPFPAFLPPPAKAPETATLPSPTRPSLPNGERTQANPTPPAANKAASKAPAIAHSKSLLEPSVMLNFQAQPNLPAASLEDVQVRIKSAVGGWKTVNLATAIRDALEAFTPSGFVFEFPDRMRVGSTYNVRLTTRQNLNDLLRQKLQDQGIPAEYLKGIVTSAVADVLLPGDNSFVIRREEPAAGHSSNTWVWRVEARQPGNHKLELIVTLSAQIPSRGEVEANAAMLSRTVAVDADPSYGNFFDRHWLEMAASLAGLMGAWLIWMLWRTRGAAFTHR
jgi:hypothetical protein